MGGIDKKFSFFVFSIIALSLVLTIFLHEKISGNKELLGLIANIFSILTGFLLLVITTSGETAVLAGKQSKSENYANKKRFEIRFSRYMLLFYLYLTVLCLIFFYYMLLPSSCSLSDFDLPPHEWISSTLEFIICWLSIISFWCSFFIPMRLKKLYSEKINRN